MTLKSDYQYFRRALNACFVLCVVLIGCNPQQPIDDDVIVLVIPDASISSEDRGVMIPRPEARFNSARPTRLSTQGGTRLTVIGRFFDEATTVSIDGQVCHAKPLRDLHRDRVY